MEAPTGPGADREATLTRPGLPTANRSIPYLMRLVLPKPREPN